MDLPIDLKLPPMYRVHQKIEAPVVADVAATVREELLRIGLAQRVRPGMRIALTAGSRGIANIPIILAAAVRTLRELGADPFVIPTMGSHGGATPEGQAGMLASLGVTEATVGAPILSSLEVLPIGTTAEGVLVYLDKYAAGSDGIVVIGRVKAHTAFQGPIESGLMKMMAIGLGKHKGALATHRAVIRYSFQKVIPSVARVVLEKAPILCGLAILENAYDQTAVIQAMPPAELESTEAELLKLAKKLMARLPYEKLDLLVVDEMGKDVSGTGMDTNVVGRIMHIASPEPTSPRITRIFVRGLTEATHGNATGIGLADFTTRRLADRMDRWATYVNGVTGGSPEKSRIPIICENDRQAIVWALTTIGPVESEDARIVWIKNTLEMEDILVSQSLLPEIEGRPTLEVAAGPLEIRYDGDGNLVELFSRRKAGVAAVGY